MKPYNDWSCADINRDLLGEGMWVSRSGTRTWTGGVGWNVSTSFGDLLSGTLASRQTMTSEYRLTFHRVASDPHICGSDGVPASATHVPEAK